MTTAYDRTVKMMSKGKPNGYSGTIVAGKSGTAINDQEVDAANDQVMIIGEESGLSLPPPTKNAIETG